MPHEAIARLYDPSGITVVGSGLLTTSGALITATSAAQNALGAGKVRRRAHVAKDATVIIDFPFSGSVVKSEVPLRRWTPTRSSRPYEGIATFDATGLDVRAASLDPTREYSGEVPVSAWLFDSDSGEPHEMRLVANAIEGHTFWTVSANDHASNSFDLRGAFAWEGESVLVGMVMGRVPQSPRYYLSPREALIERDFVSIRSAGSPKWHFRHATETAPLTLVKDLELLEVDGLDKPECEQVKLALNELTEQLVLVEAQGLVFDRPPSARAQDLYDVYDQWNGGQKGEAGRAHRQAFLVSVADSAGALQRAAGPSYPPTIYDTEVKVGAQQVMDLFAALPAIVDDRGKTRFPQVKKMLAQYRRRS